MKLVKYDSMCSAIAVAYKVDEVKSIRDKAVALEAYARQAKNIEAERQACEIRLRAERKAGILLKAREKADGHLAGRNADGSVRRSPHATTETLVELGISKNQSSQWQKLGEVPQTDFEQALKEADKPTTNGIIRATSEPKRSPVAADALWLWGRLQDFERTVLAKSPEAVMRTLPDKMRDDVHTLAPKVAAWLKRIGARAA